MPLFAAPQKYREPPDSIAVRYRRPAHGASTRWNRPHSRSLSSPEPITISTRRLRLPSSDSRLGRPPERSNVMESLMIKRFAALAAAVTLIGAVLAPSH